jgi:hypothetical protein
MFIYRTKPWRLQRVIHTQVGWNRVRHRAVYKWEVTWSNGAFTRHHMSKWLLWALIRSRLP